VPSPGILLIDIVEQKAVVESQNNMTRKRQSKKRYSILNLPWSQVINMRGVLSVSGSSLRRLGLGLEW
jgi:hypothetical protein